MAKVSEIVEPYFSHDIAARQDEKILKMFFSFRRLAKEMTREELESFVALGSYGIFWSIVEYMHRNSLAISDSDVVADDLRVSEKFVKMVLNDFELFRQENNQYVSDRIQANINKQVEKSSANSKAAKAKWMLSALKNSYLEIFEREPALNEKEKAIFLKYADSISNFKEILPDILYTLKTLRFDNNAKFNPNINWLLTDNHMTKLINEEYGKLKNWQAIKDLKQQEKLQAKQEKSEQINIDTIHNRVDAVDLLLRHSAYSQTQDRLTVSPIVQPLLKKFDIDGKEIKEMKRKALENV